MHLSDRITGPFLVGLGAIAAYGGSRLPPVPGQQIGPNVFPLVVGIGLSICGVMIALGVGRHFEEEAEADLLAHEDPIPDIRAHAQPVLRPARARPAGAAHRLRARRRQAWLRPNGRADRAYRGKDPWRELAARGAARRHRADLRPSRLLQAAPGSTSRGPPADAVVTMSDLLDAFRLVPATDVLIAILLSSIYGLVVGSLPGLSATMATALLVPVTFYLSPIAAVATIISASAMAIFSGDIPGCLLRIPGTPASAAYTDEAYAMTRKGQPSSRSASASVVLGARRDRGHAVADDPRPDARRDGAVVLDLRVFLARLPRPDVRDARRALLAGESDRQHAPRPPVLLRRDGESGRHAALHLRLDGPPRRHRGDPGARRRLRRLGGHASDGDAGPAALPRRRFGSIMAGQWALTKKYPKQQVRGNIIGIIIGVLPGAGADMAAWVSYAMAKRFSKEPEKFGTGHPEGLIEAGASNNASLASGWVPALLFGIPGDTITAIAIGVLYMKGLNPGPTLFTERASSMYALYIIFIIANIIMIPLGIAMIRLASLILRAPRSSVMPVIILCCAVGTFATGNNLFNVICVAFFGVLGFVMEKNGYPVAALVLGIVMGTMVEQSFVTSLIKSDGSLLPFFERPVSAVLAAMTIACLVWPFFVWGRRWITGRRGVRRSHRVALSRRLSCAIFRPAHPAGLFWHMPAGALRAGGPE